MRTANLRTYGPAPYLLSGVQDVHNGLRVSPEQERSEAGEDRHAEASEKGETSSPMAETTTARPARH